MNIQEFIEQVGKNAINKSFTETLERHYGVTLNEYIRRVLSFNPDGVLFENNDILRLLSHKEIIEANVDMAIDFTALKLIPILDTGDNDFITFDISSSEWCKFNIVDTIKYKQRQSLSDYF